MPAESVSVMEPFRVAIIGTGYVGLTTGLTLGYLGYPVVCFDIDAGKIDALNQGQLPAHEPFAGQMLRAVAARMSYTSDPSALADADIVFIAVNTPSAEDGTANLEYVRSAAATIGREMRRPYVVAVNKSTVPVGSASLVDDEIRRSFCQTHGGTPDGRLDVASNPEFLREGSALHDSLYPDRIVVGADSGRAAEVMRRLYAPLLEQNFEAPAFLPRPVGLPKPVMLQTSIVSAELIKYASNAFLATKISFANEVAALAEASGADIRDVCRGMGLDRRIGLAFLGAGLGWGGSCFGKDTSALAATGREYGIAMPITEAARAINLRQRGLAVSKLRDRLKILKGKTIGILGLAFKPDTDDLRDAPALEIAQKLIAHGARIQAHDPCALDRARLECGRLGITFCDSAMEAADQADALLIATEWEQYRALPWPGIAARMRGKIVLDGRNCLNRGDVTEAGLEWVGFGC